MAELITGTNENDQIDAFGGNNIIDALGGFDKIFEYGGVDTINGGEDADMLIYFTRDKGVSIDLALETEQDIGESGRVTLSSIEHILAKTGRGGDTISGTIGTNRIETGRGKDSINARGGNDLIITAEGTKLIDGGDGFDVYQFQSVKRAGIFDGVKLSLASQGSVQFSGRLTITLSNIEALDGGYGDDVLIGDDMDNVLSGNRGNDELRGGAGHDTIFGDGYHAIDGEMFKFTRSDGLVLNGGDDRLYGGAGDDKLFGGTGIDTMTGGEGDDTFYVETAGDKVVELTDGGTDTVKSSAYAYTMRANVENLTLLNFAFQAIGNRLANQLIGNKFVNELYGKGGDDTLSGAAGNDSLFGGDGDDVLNGGMGNDTLTGGEGRNIFRFNTALGTDVIDNFDTITDFKPASDTIQLENAMFAAYGSAKGVIGASTFKIIETGDATDADDIIVYNSATGALFYDANGNTNGLDDATQIATLSKGLVLTNADFVLI